MLEERGDLPHELEHVLKHFRRGAEGMAELLSDSKNVGDFRRSVCSGAEVATALARNKERDVHSEGLQLGAQAVASLLSDDADLDDEEQYRLEVAGFCQGVESTMETINNVDDDKASILGTEEGSSDDGS
ncbi:hypothetical protein IMZ48_20320 [Candidatus Bathyarchaeota archaeon]|nr:hypothetical protein [Candidatus Bathyarchaeota archaeon]